MIKHMTSAQPISTDDASPIRTLTWSGIAILAVGAMVGLLGLLALLALAGTSVSSVAPSGHELVPATPPQAIEAPECAGLARQVARRQHSMLDGTAFHRTEREAYQVCVSDPAAFRRLLR